MTRNVTIDLRSYTTCRQGPQQSHRTCTLSGVIYPHLSSSYNLLSATVRSIALRTSSEKLVRFMCSCIAKFAKCGGTLASKGGTCQRPAEQAPPAGSGKRRADVAIQGMTGLLLPELGRQGSTGKSSPAQGHRVPDWAGLASEGTREVWGWQAVDARTGLV